MRPMVLGVLLSYSYLIEMSLTFPLISAHVVKLSERIPVEPS